MSVELKSIPLVVQPSNRGNSTDTDARLVNAYIERQPDGSVHVVRRPAVRYDSTLNYGGSAETMVGYLSVDYTSFAAVHKGSPFGTRFYRLSNGASPTDLGSLPVGLSTPWEMIYVLSSPRKIFLAAKGFGVVFNTGTNTLTTLTTFPPSSGGDRIGPLVYLDGLVFILTEDGRLWNSNVNDPDTWASLSFLQVNTDNDLAVAIQKQLTYVVAFKSRSIEVFYNAAKPQGSPLARNDSAKNSEVGLFRAETLVRINDTLIWLSNSATGKLSVHTMRRLQVTEVATPNISRILRTLEYMDTAHAFGVHSGGHEYYVLYISRSAGDSLVLCYDLTTEAWAEWSGTTLNAGGLTYVDSFVGNMESLVYVNNSTDVYKITNQSFQDSLPAGVTATIPVDIYTPLWDQQVRLKKHNVKLEVHGDQKSAGTVQVRTTDDDYQTWGPTRDMNLADGVATSINWGTFRRRGWHISNNENVPFRVTNLIAHISLGTT